MTLPSSYTAGQSGHLADHATIAADIASLTASVAAKAALPGVALAMFYVDPVNGNDSNDGVGWGSAFATVAAALTALGSNPGTIYLSAGTHAITNVTLVAAQFLEGVGPGTILSTNTAGWAVTIASNAAGLRNLKIVLGTVPTGGLTHNDGAFFCRSHGIEVEATVKTTGQIGIRWAQTAATGVYWNRVSESKVNNCSKSLQVVSSGAFGANVNAFFGNIYQSDTCIEIGDTTTGFEFDGSMDSFASGLGISLLGTANRNWFRCRVEGGTLSKAYDFAAGTFENVLIMDDNCPVASVDASTAKTNLVTVLADGKTKPWAAPTSFVPLGNPWTDATADTAIDGSSNIAAYVPFMVTQPISFTKINVGIGTSSGNVDVGVVSISGTSVTKIVGTGSTPSPGTGQRQFTVTSTRLTPGRYLIYVEADNATAAFKVAGTNGPGSMVNARLTTVGAFPHPATAVVTVGWDKLVQATVQA